MACNCNKNDKIREAVRNGVKKAIKKESRSEKVESLVRQAVREMLSEDDDYQEFVQGVMETLNIDSPQDLTEEGREKFFNMLGNNYNEDTDEADDIPTSEIKNTMGPSDYEDKSKCPDFLKQEEQVREHVRNALQNLLR